MKNIRLVEERRELQAEDDWRDVAADILVGLVFILSIMFSTPILRALASYGWNLP